MLILETRPAMRHRRISVASAENLSPVEQEARFVTGLFQHLFDLTAAGRPTSPPCFLSTTSVLSC